MKVIVISGEQINTKPQKLQVVKKVVKQFFFHFFNRKFLVLLNNFVVGLTQAKQKIGQ